MRSSLRSVLPEYMIPSAFVTLERIPLTPNGKVDRKALPNPDLAASVSREYEEPRDETEQLLASIWESLLSVERIGRYDHFFELGGHSLAAMQAVARLQSILSMDIPLRAVFECPVLKDLAERLDELRMRRLSSKMADGGADVERLLDEIESMPDDHVRQLLADLTLEGRS